MQKLWSVVDNPKISFYFCSLDEEKKIAEVHSTVGKCNDFLSFINGTSDWDGIKLNKIDGWVNPTEIKLNRWEPVGDSYNWKIVGQEQITGINWTYVNHSSKGENECFGIGIFSYENLEKVPVEKEETIFLPSRSFRVLQEIIGSTM